MVSRRATGWTSHMLTHITVDAIIFLAPISGFDQVLTEDRTVNRLVRDHMAPSVK